MKILYTESSPNIGGQELQALAQMAAMQRAGHSVMLACRENSRIAAEAVRQQTAVTYIPFRNSLHFSSVWRLRRLVLTFRPDMVVCHSGHDSNTVALTRATLTGGAGRFSIVRQKTYLTRKMKVFSLNHLCDAVAVPGQAMKEALQAAGCTNTIRVVSPGFDFDAIREAMSMPLPEHVREWLEARAPHPVIVQIGMLRPEKGQDFMLKTLFHLKREGGQFHWLIVGGGRPEEERLLRRKIHALGMEGCVLICGYLTPVYPLYRVASLMVMPSTCESFGMAAVEAAACGVPVMASNTGGLSSVIHHERTGILLPPDNRQAWLEALRAYLSAPAGFAEMAAMARRDVMSRFSMEVTLDRLLSLGCLPF